MFDINNIDKNQLDFFRELENIGAGHAATALAEMLSHKVSICVPKAQICRYNEITDILHGPENVVAGLLVGIVGDINGFILLVMDDADAQSLSGAILGDMVEGMSGDDLREMQLSAMKELANILIGSYITAISSLTGLAIEATVPDLVIDMAGAVMNLLAVAYAGDGDAVLSMETEFIDDSKSLYGHFFLIPDNESFKTLLNKMEAF